jgi:hypothetical protein
MKLLSALILASFSGVVGSAQVTNQVSVKVDPPKLEEFQKCVAACPQGNPMEYIACIQKCSPK